MGMRAPAHGRDVLLMFRSEATSGACSKYDFGWILVRGGREGSVGGYLVELPDPGEEDAVREAGEVGEDVGREEATGLGSSLGLCDLCQQADRSIEGRARLTRFGWGGSGNGGLAPASGLGLAGH
jgi:hypothetical protein